MTPRAILNLLRRTWWWKWVGVVWGALFVVWPSAAYAARVLGR